MKKIIISFGVLLVVLVALIGVTSMYQKPVGNTPNSAENAPPGSIHNLPLPPGVAAVKAFAAKEAGVEEGKVLIQTAFEKEWSDSCLGLGGPAESCLFVITPGWEVTLEANGETFVYRANTDGTVIRLQK